MSPRLQRVTTTSAWLMHLIESPELVRTVQALPGPTFSALVRSIGVEDAGELLALATTDQLVDAFDEDLFTNRRPGQRETFDPARFVVWLEVLLDAGEAQAAQRFTQLSFDFVVQALSSLVLVVDHDALLDRMAPGDAAARRADKAIESTLSEEIDGYLLLSRQPDGWDAVLSLILALDREKRSFLERVLDRCAQLASGCLDDLDALSTALSAEESLAESVEAEREARRTEHGYVDPRAARAFLRLARTPATANAAPLQRDPVTAAYFRERTTAQPSPRAPTRHPRTAVSADPPSLPAALTALLESDPLLRPALPAAQVGPSTSLILDTLRRLHEHAPAIFAQRMEELAYLANVLVAGAAQPDPGQERLRPPDAAQATLFTVELGATLAAQAAPRSPTQVPAQDALLQVLTDTPADLLFRHASQRLAAPPQPIAVCGFVRTAQELAAAQKRL